mgnify:CR=1 FL=1
MLSRRMLLFTLFTYGAGFLYQWILPIVIGNSVVIQIAVMKPLRLYSPNAFPTVSLVLGLLAPPF